MQVEAAKPVRVFLAEDSIPVRTRIAAALGESGITVVGGSGAPQDCIQRILQAQPDVVVLDVQLEGGSGLDVLRAVHGAAPRIGFVVFSNCADPAYRKRYLGAGASSFIDKTSHFTDLSQAVFAAAR